MKKYANLCKLALAYMAHGSKRKHLQKLQYSTDLKLRAQNQFEISMSHSLLAWKCRNITFFGNTGTSEMFQFKSMRGLAEKRRTHDHWTISVVSSSPTMASVFVSLGKVLNLNLLRWPESIWDLSVVGNVYNLSADKVCTWPVASHPRWSEMIVTISWRGNNIGNSAFFP